MEKDLSTKIWIAFLDENGKKIEGYFEKIAETEQYLKVKSENNIFIIPYNRLLKAKENIERRLNKK